MAGDTGGSDRPLDYARQTTIDALCEHFANDVMGMEEFERRVESAHRAGTNDELRDLLRDLPVAGNLPSRVPGPAPVPTPGGGSAVSGPVPEHSLVLSVMGGNSRKGRWRPARKNFAISVMGGTHLDFREAALAPGVTDVYVFAVWGGVEIIVPPGMHVETHGFAILGGFDHMGDEGAGYQPGAPTLRVSGVTCMGGVEIVVRYPGESSRDARRRRKLERTERHRLRGGE
ncbi:MAG: DUF1707 domain-containing protein [Gemmatimonadota bacterium]|nr:DUF1707 domain-containing protein [Gemmatimonadota bacterium]MDH5760384.1 DUF1707 domain-containing protein [Gemmatimonadota bacterium]